MYLQTHPSPKKQTSKQKSKTNDIVCLGDGKDLAISYFMFFVLTETFLTIAVNGCLDLHFHALVVRFFYLPGDGLIACISGGADKKICFRNLF